MKKAIAFSCLLLMTAVPVAAWAATCCPPDHDMNMRSAGDCLVPATQAASASAALKPSTEKSQRLLISDAPDGVAPHDGAELRAADTPSIGGPSPGISQTSPVLLR